MPGLAKQAFLGETLRVLPVHVWVFSWYFSSLLQSTDLHIGSADYSQLPKGVNSYPVMDWCPVQGAPRHAPEVGKNLASLKTCNG